MITLQQITNGTEPILHVSHDSEDDDWQFLGAGDAREEDASVVSLEYIVELDRSVLALADLPPGWHAWRRSPGEPWTREPAPGEAPEGPPLVKIPRNLRRFYIIANGGAAAVATVAAIINAFVGPVNLALWIVPVAIVAVSGGIFIVIDGFVSQVDKPRGFSLARELFGERGERFFRRLFRLHMWLVFHFFLWTVTVSFFTVAVVLLIDAVLGKITPGP